MTNFDGAQHYSGSPIPNERAYAANQRATAGVLQGALAEAYTYLREHAALLACHTFPNPGLTPINSTSLQLVTRVTAAWLPPHATAIVLASRHILMNNCKGYHLLRIVGTPDIDSAIVAGRASDAAPIFDPDEPTPSVLDALVYMPITDALLAASSVARTALTLELYAYALDESDATNAVDYRPISMAFYWLSEY